MSDARALIEKAIEFAGSEAKLGNACGVTQQAIWSAKVTGRPSAEIAMRIERATEGLVPARALRPDLPWPAAPLAPPVAAE